MLEKRFSSLGTLRLSKRIMAVGFVQKNEQIFQFGSLKGLSFYILFGTTS